MDLFRATVSKGSISPHFYLLQTLKWGPILETDNISAVQEISRRLIAVFRGHRHLFLSWAKKSNPLPHISFSYDLL
jgi:hypothetical protein